MAFHAIGHTLETYQFDVATPPTFKNFFDGEGHYLSTPGDLDGKVSLPFATQLDNLWIHMRARTGTSRQIVGTETTYPIFSIVDELGNSGINIQQTVDSNNFIIRHEVEWYGNVQEIELPIDTSYNLDMHVGNNLLQVIVDNVPVLGLVPQPLPYLLSSIEFNREDYPLLRPKTYHVKYISVSDTIKSDWVFDTIYPSGVAENTTTMVGPTSPEFNDRRVISRIDPTLDYVATAELDYAHFQFDPIITIPNDIEAVQFNAVFYNNADAENVSFSKSRFNNVEDLVLSPQSLNTDGDTNLNKAILEPVDLKSSSFNYGFVLEKV